MNKKEQTKYNEAKFSLISKLIEFFILEDFAEQSRPNFNSFIQKLGYRFLDDVSEDNHNFFLNIMLLDYPIEDDKTVVQLFWESQSDAISKREMEILEQVLDATLGVYEIVDINKFKGRYLLRDILTQKEKIISVDQDYIEQIKIGDIIFTRVVKVGEEAQTIGTISIIVANFKKEIINEVNKMYLGYLDNLKMNFSKDNLVKSFFREKGLEVFYLISQLQKLIDEEIDELEYNLVDKLYEASYLVQSKSLVIKKLIAYDTIEYDLQEEGFDFLVWISDDPVKASSDEYQIYGKFILGEGKMLFHSNTLDKFEEGKDLIKSLLSFSVIYKNEQVVDLSDDRGIPFDKLVELLSTLPIEFDDNLEGDNIFELLSSFKGRYQLEVFLDILEMHTGGFGENSEELIAIKKLKRLVMLYKEEERFSVEDGVEQLLLDHMIGYYQSEEVNEAILLWRDYKETVDKIQGRDKSWASAVEYIINKFRYYDFTQEDIGQKYGVTAATVSSKYRNIVDILDLFQDS